MILMLLHSSQLFALKMSSLKRAVELNWIYEVRFHPLTLF